MEQYFAYTKYKIYTYIYMYISRYVDLCLFTCHTYTSVFIHSCVYICILLSVYICILLIHIIIYMLPVNTCISMYLYVYIHPTVCISYTSPRTLADLPPASQPRANDSSTRIFCCGWFLCGRPLPKNTPVIACFC